MLVCQFARHRSEQQQVAKGRQVKQHRTRLARLQRGQFGHRRPRPGPQLLDLGQHLRIAFERPPCVHLFVNGGSFGAEALVEALTDALVVLGIAALPVQLQQLQVRQGAGAAAGPQVPHQEVNRGFVLAEHNEEVGLLLQIQHFLHRHRPWRATSVGRGRRRIALSRHRIAGKGDSGRGVQIGHGLGRQRRRPQGLRLLARASGNGRTRHTRHTRHGRRRRWQRRSQGNWLRATGAALVLRPHPATSQARPGLQHPKLPAQPGNDQHHRTERDQQQRQPCAIGFGRSDTIAQMYSGFLLLPVLNDQSLDLLLQYTRPFREHVRGVRRVQIHLWRRSGLGCHLQRCRRLCRLICPCRDGRADGQTAQPRADNAGGQKAVQRGERWVQRRATKRVAGQTGWIRLADQRTHGRQLNASNAMPARHGCKQCSTRTVDAGSRKP